MQNQMSMASQPQLGAPIPGTTGGLPALSGLSVTQNPMAQQLQSMGRGDDTMLIHMTPDEVNSLQGLALASGGSLTINPHTGLPEAGWLGKLLPTLLGGALAFIPGVGPLMAAGIIGAGQTALTGDLGKGLTAGLQAFGGASLGTALGAQSVLGEAAKNVGTGVAGAGGAGAHALPTAAAGEVGRNAALTAAQGAAQGTAHIGSQAAQAATQGGLLSKFGTAAQQGLPGGMIGKAAPMLAGTGLISGISEATAPQMPKYDPNAEDDFEYVPMGPGRREVRYQTPEQMRQSGGAEFQYFTPSNPAPVPLYGQPRGYAEGGTAASSQSFEDMVAYFNATNPGAITAPSTYPANAAPAATAAPTMPTQEVVHNFQRKPSTAASIGIADGTGPYGSFNIGDFSGVDFDTLLNNIGYARQPTTPSAPQTAPAAPAIRDALFPEAREDTYNSTGPSGAYIPPVAPAIPTPAAPPIMDIEAITESYTPKMSLPILQQEEREESTLPMAIRRKERANAIGLPEAYANGGVVNMRDGSFVVDARTVSELGNGSSNAGIDMLSRMGGRPVRGPGDGVSDSVRASIGGKQEARVARDEVIFSPEAVRRLGGGSDAKGTKKLYALMDKAHRARKKAKRGQDTRVRKGLA